MLRIFSLLAAVTLLTGCAAATGPAPAIPMDSRDLAAGSSVTRAGKPVTLLGNTLTVGQTIPATALLDSTLQPRQLTDFRGEVLLLSIVPSLDTGVCERQTRQLAELLPQLPAGARVITISRDLPFAQARFAGTLKGGDGILFLSDYAEGRFGRDSGLLVKEMMLLARAVLVVDREGVIRYRQLLPDIAHLPDLPRALGEVRKLTAN